MGDYMTPGEAIVEEAKYKADAALAVKDRIVSKLRGVTADRYERRATELANSPDSYEKAHIEASKKISNSAESRSESIAK